MDHDRPLNDRGEHDAPGVGRLLLKRALVPDLVLCSTAVRAVETARRVTAEAGYGGELVLTRRLYLAAPETYLAVIQEVDDGCERLLVVGHNPGLSHLVGALTGEETELPTAALVQVELAAEKWRDARLDRRAKLISIDRPRELD